MLVWWCVNFALTFIHLSKAGCLKWSLNSFERGGIYLFSWWWVVASAIGNYSTSTQRQRHDSLNLIRWSSWNCQLKPEFKLKLSKGIWSLWCLVTKSKWQGWQWWWSNVYNHLSPLKKGLTLPLSLSFSLSLLFFGQPSASFNAAA